MKSYINIFFVIVCVMIISSNSLAGGSLGYDDIRQKLPNDKIMFETLEQSLNFSEVAFASIRIMSNKSEKFAGMRLGPYYVCARQKYGEHFPVRVIFITEYIFIGKDGKIKDENFKFNDKNTSEIKENLVRIVVEKVDPDKYFPYQCE